MKKLGFALSALMLSLSNSPAVSAADEMDNHEHCQHHHEMQTETKRSEENVTVAFIGDGKGGACARIDGFASADDLLHEVHKRSAVL